MTDDGYCGNSDVVTVATVTNIITIVLCNICKWFLLVVRQEGAEFEGGRKHGSSNLVSVSEYERLGIRRETECSVHALTSNL